ncbi:DUF4352 domain-containing protein [Gracilibacillus salitolerans]|nr:DUF4352 domain-containing protein [Gracilibacillus salitolerans]
MRMLRLSLLTLFMVMALIACSSDDDEAQEPNEDETPDTEETQDNVEDDTESPAQEENEDENETSDNENNSEEQLSLGDSTEVQTPSGDYELTVNSFEFLDDFEGEQPDRDTFVLVQFEVKNISDSPIVAEEIYEAILFDADDISSDYIISNSSVDVFGEEEIQPGETKEGEFLFSHNESDSYILHFNYGFLESIATNVTYELSAGDASN